MHAMKRPEIVNKIATTMHLRFPEVVVYLYGSEARGDATPQSDIDLLILLNKERISMSDRIALREPLFDIELEAGIPITSYFDTVKGWAGRVSEFTQNVNREGILLGMKT